MPKEKKKKITEIEGPCGMCLMLALCKNKSWYALVSTCQNLRFDLCKYAKGDCVRHKSSFVKVLHLNVKFSIYRQSEPDDDKFMVGPG